MFTGIFCPSITIVDDDENIDYELWGKHLDHLCDAGINGVLLFGSIGEFYAFSVEQKKQAIKFAKERIDGRMKLFFGIGDTNLNNVIELAKYGEQVGVDALVAVSPYYFGPSDNTAKSYYKAIAQATDLPIILYNFPDRTGSDLDPALVAELCATHKNIVGIKDTVDTISHTRQIIVEARKVRPDFTVLSGFDEYYLVNRVSGGNGVLSGLTNVEPETFVAMHKAYEAGDYAGAIENAKRISHLMKIYGVGDLFISAIKAGVNAKGLPISTKILEPATQVTEADIEAVREILK